jgi:hypothetical protein
MRMLVATGALLSLLCISAVNAPSNYQSYGGYPVFSDPALRSHFERAYGYCDREASWRYPRVDNSVNPMFTLAVKACLYRHSFVDRGVYSYPANQIFLHFFDR